jgi:hypothetical protein
MEAPSQSDNGNCGFNPIGSSPSEAQQSIVTRYGKQLPDVSKTHV